MVASVIVDISTSEIDRIFEYLVPSGMQVRKGDRVLVPFGNKTIEGFCIDLKDSPDTSRELKEIIDRLDPYSAITEEQLELAKFMRARYYIRHVDCLRLFIPSKLRGGRVRELKRQYVCLAQDRPYEQLLEEAATPARRAVVERLKEGGEFLSRLTSEVSASCVNTLIKHGILIKTDREIMRSPLGYEPQKSELPLLRPAQQAALETILSMQRKVALLYGVTGSGKTEVYMRCIAQALQEGKTAIMLVPEISLTPQTLKIFRSRFGDIVAMLHSGLSDGERFDEWRRIITGDAKVVVGARSAIFAPLKNVGVIIIDEEHDSSYVSESNPRYITADIAKWRAEYNGGKVILGSATPSIESFLLAKRGQYELVRMDERISGNMPDMHIVDMKQEIISGNNGIFSAELTASLKDTVARGEQAMIFLNRRGHSSFVMCKKCGYTAKCTDCDITLTYHSADNKLKCHYCGKRYKMLDCCPECGSREIRYGKIGTQRVVEELKKIFPDINILRMDNETTATKTAYLDILGAFASGEAQILVGTQMIAKGHDFPNVTLVGILDADMSLYFSDYRSAERTFQLVTQVAGRAGRAAKLGKVILQTYSPNHYVFRFAARYDYDGFFDKENNTRLVSDFPPYTTIMRIMMSGADEDKVIECAKAIYLKIKPLKDKYDYDIVYMQAMKSPVGKIENKFRYQILLRFKRVRERNIIADAYKAMEEGKTKGVSVFAEINPQNLN
ncbi:MAG TPA: primosomal protein N' [Candidatus Caccalectryoclostridium excrementigallinarum]|uniref:Replication restart protein PriA n=1 Tax=Candidatus Caccalectryoclostridium excrementigallinarum TaxID=2840710 RepID=A0A9D1MN86_9FIRM|nr:primosomal protein N' [Candidatus Caccalectryoclostridium excrementigallinarum]